MEEMSLKSGSRYRIRDVKDLVFRYDGQNPDGGYIFTKFSSRDGELVGDVKVFCLDHFEPVGDDDEVP